MGWWFLPIGFWVVGMVLMLGGHYFLHKIGEIKEKWHHRSEDAEPQDSSSSFYFAIGEKALDTVPWVTVHLVYILLGMVVFALGFVALSFII